MISFSVPGKIHLLGEHSVVYGKPALFSSISLKISVILSDNEESLADASNTEISPDEIEDARQSRRSEILQQKLQDDIQKLQKVLENAIKKKFLIKKIPTYKISITSELPIGSGLGSSAAISVGWTKVLLKLLKIPEDKNQIFEIALEGEKIFHGNPSGGDIAAVLNEGLTWFRKESEDLKIIQPLSFPISENLQNFFLIDSGKPVESTGQMVNKVAHLILQSPPTRHPEEPATRDLKIKYQKIFNHQEELVKKLTTALKNGDEKLLMDCIKKGERNLEKLGVVGKKAKQIIKIVESKGGVAKILGGGGAKEGSGMLLGYLNKKGVSELTKTNKWRIIPINLGAKLL